MNRTICVVTGSRAEYGLLSNLMKAIKGDPRLRLRVIATGMHLSPEFGLTWKAIEEDGFRIDRKVEMLLSSDTAVGIGKSMGLAQIGFSDAFEELSPDLIVLLGDRFETLAAASSALIARIPVAHLHGGELTEGAYDDSIRHAVTKLSHLHFTSTETYRERVIQLGEEPDRVFNVGALGLDSIATLATLGKAELGRELGVVWRKRNILVTFHPATLDSGSPETQLKELLEALDGLPDTLLLFTKANADSDGRVINRMLEEYSAGNPGRAKVFPSLGQLRYISALRHVDAVVGNSSSGIIEAPSIPVATVNIGDRQKGRLRAASVVDCAPERQSILGALAETESPSFRAALRSMANPYGDGRSASRIHEILAGFDLESLSRKRFYDLPGAKP